MASNSAIIIPPRTNAPAALAITNDIRPIKPPVTIRNPWAIAAWAGGAVVVLWIIGLLLAWFFRRRAIIKATPIPPHVRARDRIDAALLLINDPRAFCIEVSNAVRVYLEERFNLRAPERTTEEFLRDLQSTNHLSREQKGSLVVFLERCDLVKFAKFEPTEASLRELHESALRLVHETQYDALASTPPPPLPAETTNT